MDQYSFYNKDPRRMQPMVDYLFEKFNSVDFNAESTFDVVKVLSFFRAFYEELSWKFAPWTDEVLRRCWPEISSEHDDVSYSHSSRFHRCEHFFRCSHISVNSWRSVTRLWQVLKASEVLLLIIHCDIVATQYFCTYHRGSCARMPDCAG